MKTIENEINVIKQDLMCLMENNHCNLSNKTKNLKQKYPEVYEVLVLMQSQINTESQISKSKFIHIIDAMLDIIKIKHLYLIRIFIIGAVIVGLAATPLLIDKRNIFSTSWGK